MSGVKTRVTVKGVVSEDVSPGDESYEVIVQDRTVPRRQVDVVPAGENKAINSYITIMWPNSAAGVTASLPDLSAAAGKEFIISKVGNTFPILLLPDGSQTIDTSATTLVNSASYGAVHIIAASGSSGTPFTWLVISNKNNALDEDADAP